jgi:hypothetical protein
MRRAAICTLLCALAVTLACSVSPSEERKLGVEMAASADSQLPLVRDTVVLSFVRELGRSEDPRGWNGATNADQRVSWRRTRRTSRASTRLVESFDDCRRLIEP